MGVIVISVGIRFFRVEFDRRNIHILKMSIMAISKKKK